MRATLSRRRGSAELRSEAGVTVAGVDSRTRRVEASALPTRLTAGRAPLSAAFLRLRSDEQLVALFRAGSDDAFRAIHERYGARLLAYTRQMLRGGGDPEDALQDVFIRAYRSLRSSDRPVMLRAWLYRIAHNRCIDELRRPHPLPSELAGDAEPAFGAPAALARAAGGRRTQRRARASGRRRAHTPEPAALGAADARAAGSQLRGARERDGDLGAGGEVAAAARAHRADRDQRGSRHALRRDPRRAAPRRRPQGARIGGRARRHCGECAICEAYRGELKRVSRGFASLTPSGPLAQLGMLLGFGGGGGSGGGAQRRPAGARGGGRRRCRECRRRCGGRRRRAGRPDRDQGGRRGLLRGAAHDRRSGRDRPSTQAPARRGAASSATRGRRPASRRRAG